METGELFAFSALLVSRASTVPKNQEFVRVCTICTSPYPYKNRPSYRKIVLNRTFVDALVGTFEDQRSNLTLGGCIKIDKESFTHPRCRHSVLRVPGQLKMANPDYQGLAEYAAGLCDSEILCSISIPIATALNLQYQYRYKCLLASPFNSNIAAIPAGYTLQ